MFHIDEELASKFKDTNFVARFGKYLGTYVSDSAITNRFGLICVGNQTN